MIPTLKTVVFMKQFRHSCTHRNDYIKNLPLAVWLTLRMKSKCNLWLTFLQSQTVGFPFHIYERLKKKKDKPAVEGEKFRKLVQATIWSNESSASPHTHCRTLQWQITTPEVHLCFLHLFHSKSLLIAT